MPRDRHLRSLSEDGLFPLLRLQHLNRWIKSAREHERERAVEVSVALLECYREKLHVSVSLGWARQGRGTSATIAVLWSSLPFPFCGGRRQGLRGSELGPSHC